MKNKKINYSIILILLIFVYSCSNKNRLLTGLYCNDNNYCIQLIDSLSYRQGYLTDFKKNKIKSFLFYENGKHNFKGGRLLFRDFKYDSIVENFKNIIEPNENNQTTLIYRYSNMFYSENSILFDFDLPEEQTFKYIEN